MPATPARIALSTSDGVVISRADPTLRQNHPNAVDQGDSEIEMFYDTAADGEAMLEERWQLVKSTNRFHEAIETDSSFGLGTTVPITPALPTISVTDEDRGIDGTAVIRASAADYQAERYSLELIG